MKYFKLSEFDSPDKIGSGEEMKQSTLNLLDMAREISGIAFVINSGYRTDAQNKKVSGKLNSSHLKGYAIDVACNDSVKRFKIINAALKVGFTRIGVGETFVHLDNDPSKAQNVIWTY
jgi:uncharacterized protein YcbK (DUF882 family)